MFPFGSSAPDLHCSVIPDQALIGPFISRHSGPASTLVVQRLSPWLLRSVAVQLHPQGLGNLFGFMMPVTINFMPHSLIDQADWKDLLMLHSQVFANAAIILLHFTAYFPPVLDSDASFESTTVNTKAIATIRQNYWQEKTLLSAHTICARTFPSMTGCILLDISMAA